MWMRKSVCFIWASERRPSIHAYVFSQKSAEMLENKPEVVVDRRPWYRWALQRLGLSYRYETLDAKMLLKGSFSC
ncbi:hypothetical protein [Geoglobus acetivorans]|uniref:Mobile element protein n=1 Tax=Geoglobus acetivorans TaxID=565033 RepID=A0ABZ3H612_GEOAI